MSLVGRRRRVVVVYKSLPQYRVALFERARARLAAEGVVFELVYGQPIRADMARADARHLPWATTVQNRELRLGRRALLWQPVLGCLHRGDLVVVEQASKLLVNYLLLLAQRLGLFDVVFWGHGRTLHASWVGEFVKRWVSRRPHWWFAYTAGTREIVVANGYPPERVTVLENAVDTDALAAAARDCSRSTPRVAGRVAFVGSLYREKGLEFLMESCSLVRAARPDLGLLIIGDGPDSRRVTDWAAEHAWVEYLGPRFGADLVSQLVTANLLLVPGAVGLVVLDAFATECPLVTIAGDDHGPEVEYLEDGVNGRVLPAGTTAADYARVVTHLLADDTAIARLRLGCRASAARYTMENMVDRFVDGCLRALGDSRGAPRGERSLPDRSVGRPPERVARRRLRRGARPS